MSYSCAAADGVGHSWMQRNVTKIIMERWTSTSWRVLWRPVRWSKIGSTPGHIVWHLRFWFADLLPPFSPLTCFATCSMHCYLLDYHIITKCKRLLHDSLQPFRHWHLHSHLSVGLRVSFVFLVFFPGYIMLYQELLQGPEVWVWSTSYLGGKVTFHSEDSSNWCRIYSAKLTHGTLVSPGQPWSALVR